MQTTVKVYVWQMFSYESRPEMGPWAVVPCILRTTTSLLTTFSNISIRNKRPIYHVLLVQLLRDRNFITQLHKVAPRHNEFAPSIHIGPRLRNPLLLQLISFEGVAAEGKKRKVSASRITLKCVSENIIFFHLRDS
ncbi:hypothetical protein CEXT_591751 [Caerostris extrusa]|uniref:Uncharacterized protein n=1 Tax=Caerostris extrusa TaxID=172846 RepID=A0AAV4PRI9_CAEEX|nr:hypothetical protein CEXT_591751 [Caerostris extrusa]